MSVQIHITVPVSEQLKARLDKVTKTLGIPKAVVLRRGGLEYLDRIEKMQDASEVARQDAQSTTAGGGNQ